MPDTKKNCRGNTLNTTSVQILTNFVGLDNTIFQLVPTCKNKDCADPLPGNQAVPEEDHRSQDGEELPDNIDGLVFF